MAPGGVKKIKGQCGSAVEGVSDIRKNSGYIGSGKQRAVDIRIIQQLLLVCYIISSGY